jgi:hypothetical protein
VSADTQLPPALGTPFTLAVSLAPYVAGVHRVEGGAGNAVALSSDGDTALVGGGAGKVWVFVRSASGWTQQAELTRNGARPGEGFGCSVALSADGNVAVVGAPGTSASLEGPAVPGAAVVFTREGQTWTEQAQLTPSDEVNPGMEQCFGFGFGTSVALSGEGTTVLVGNGADNQDRGAAWVFTLAGGAWVQQGPKLTPTDESRAGRFGAYLALSSDGSTALISAFGSLECRGSGEFEGQAWIFSREGDSWRQSTELIPRPRVCGEELGSSLALSGDGSTALLAAGAKGPWSFTRSGPSWSQQRTRLMVEPGLTSDTLAGPEGQFGETVALDGNGSTALVAGIYITHCGKYMDAPCPIPGAVWTFARFGSAWVEQGEPLASHRFDFGSHLALSGTAPRR